eukprot:6276098-Amphidinium_carterae.2
MTCNCCQAATGSSKKRKSGTAQRYVHAESAALPDEKVRINRDPRDEKRTHTDRSCNALPSEQCDDGDKE